MAMPRPVRLASATIFFLTRWLTSLTNRASFSDRFLRSLLADLVPLAWSRDNNAIFFLRRSVTAPPDQFSPSEVVAMLTIPRSTPRNPAGTVFLVRHFHGGHEVELPAVLNQVRFTAAGPDHQGRCFRGPGEGHALDASRAVQIDTFCARWFQDRLRSSNGWAAVGRNRTGCIEVRRVAFAFPCPVRRRRAGSRTRRQPS